MKLQKIYRAVLFLPLAWLLLNVPNAHAVIAFGEFRLGTPKQIVLATLTERFEEVTERHAERYQVKRDFYEATDPKATYLLDTVRITRVTVYFDASDHLSQVDLSLQTAAPDIVRGLIPDGNTAQPSGSFGDTWEIQRSDGEIVFSISTIFGTSAISFADRKQADINSPIRQASDARFKQLSGKMDHVIDQLQKSQTQGGK